MADTKNSTALVLSFALALLCASSAVVWADVLDSNLPIHDPSRIVSEDGASWIFATGNGIDVKYSADKVHWTQAAPVFGTTNTNSYWAPDMWNGRINGQWYLFYSQPTGAFGTKASRIGVLTTTSLGSPNWKDLGTIIATDTSTDFNTIDPCPYYDAAANRLWLSFGSWFGGIYVMELDPAAPTRIVSPPVRIAGGGGFAIEASYIHYRNGWFYLFANWDVCCKGGQSTYRIIVGRSRTITGPYVDKDGISLMSQGGAMFMAGAADEIGPGHFGFTTNGDSDAFTYHAYVPGSAPGPARLAQRNIVWQSDEWPRADFPAPLPDGTYNIRNKLSGLSLAVRNESTDPNAEGHIELDSISTNRASMRWQFTSTPEGYYTIFNLGTGYFLQVAGGSRNAGDFIREGTVTGPGTADAQFWRVMPLQDGSYQIQNVRSGRVLDDLKFSTAPLNPIWQWDWLYGENQKFYFDSTLGAGVQPVISSTGIVNAASFTTVISPGSLVTLKGSHLANTTVDSTFDGASGAYLTKVAGTSVTVGQHPAPLLYVSEGQINFQVPWDTPAGTPVPVQVTLNGVSGTLQNVTFSDSAPSAFATQDGTAILTCSSGGVKAGDTCSLWANGLGVKETPQQDGIPAEVRAIRTANNCVLMIGGIQAAVTYCGVAPGLIIDQVNFIYPAGVTSSTNQVKAALRVGALSGALLLPLP